MKNDYLYKIIDSDERIGKDSIDYIYSATNEMLEIFKNTFNRGGKVIIFGNGGCAGIANQTESAFIGRYKSGKNARPVLSLCSNSITITTLANDFGYENIFLKQLEGFATKLDTVIGMSASGNSKNVVRGIEFAKQNSILTVAYTGKRGGKLKEIADILISVPSEQPSIIEDSFSIINSIICKTLD